MIDYADITRTLGFLRQLPHVSPGDHENLLAAIECVERLQRIEALPAKWRDDYRLGAQDVSPYDVAVEYGGEFVTYEQIDALVKRAKRIADMWDGYGGENVEIHWRELEALREDLEPFTRAASGEGES